jgi:thymidylate synthase (FAD)
MHTVKPKVFKIAQTTLDYDGLEAMLNEQEWMTPHVETLIHDAQHGDVVEAEVLTELSGRICYRSFAPGLNPNVTKIRTDSKEYIRNTLEKGDGSIFEHASVTFAFINVSRIFTHELVRHRVGVAISQESMRYVRITDIGMWMPDELSAPQRAVFEEAVGVAEDFYKNLEASVPWDAMTMPQKKAATSALRRIVPGGIATNIIWTTNHRNLRHVLEMRTDPAAEIEIRMVFDEVGRLCKETWPLIYQDFERFEQDDGWGWWKATLRRKV